MNRKSKCFFSTLIFASCTVVRANDSAASRAVGGIQLRREADISMERERLTISQTKIVVEYEFLNQADRDISTVVAFPIPSYDVGLVDAGAPRDFNDFRLWVEGTEVKYNIEIRAKSGDQDETDLLKSFGIDIASFGYFGIDHGGTAEGQIAHLTQEQRDRLYHLGLIWDPAPDGVPRWLNSKTYFWTQLFPAHKILHVRHEYKPSIGFKTIGLDPKQTHVSDFRSAIENSCVDESLENELMGQMKRKYETSDTAFLGAVWIDYILTTANSWKTPIKDFTLVIDRRSDSQTPNLRTIENVSLCWDGPIRKLDANHLMMHRTNFVPRADLRVAFFSFLDEPGLTDPKQPPLVK